MSDLDAIHPTQPHTPVLLDAVIAALAVSPGERHVDATFGAGGYTRARCSPSAPAYSPSIWRPRRDRGTGARWKRNRAAPLTASVPATFSALDAELEARGAVPVDGVTMDIGVSSMQLDQAERGFSFQADGPLDMRMSQEGETAADFVNRPRRRSGDCRCAA